MGLTYREILRSRRQMLGMSQRDLARRCGLKQPLIAAIESGRRQPSPEAKRSLDRALELRPSTALVARTPEVEEVFTRAGVAQPKVFGSVARGEDGPGSDLDLVVEFTDEHDIVDLLALEAELSDLLTVPVDIVDARAAGDVVDRALAEAQAL